MAIGRSVKRIDTYAKVRGEALFPGDINQPDQAYLKILFSEEPHALIRAIDISEAEQVNGVIAVLSARDVPVNEYGLIMPDQPVLCGPDSGKQYAERVRFIGDQVAVVIAESEEIAAKAAKRIKVEYEKLPVVTNPIDAMQENAPLIHPDKEKNVFCHYQIRKGDIETAFADADVIVESSYVTPAQEHAFFAA